MAKEYEIKISEVDDGFWLRYVFSDGDTPENSQEVRVSPNTMANVITGLSSNLTADDAA